MRLKQTREYLESVTGLASAVQWACELVNLYDLPQSVGRFVRVLLRATEVNTRAL